MPGIGNLAAYITRAVESGMRATATLRSFRAEGLSVRTQSWFRAWGEVTDALRSRVQVAGLPGNLPVPDDAVTSWSNAPPGSYVHQVRVLARPLGSSEVQSRFVSVVSPTPLSPDEATVRAIDIWDDNTTAEGGNYPETVLGGVLVGVYGGR